MVRGAHCSSILGINNMARQWIMQASPSKERRSYWVPGACSIAPWESLFLLQSCTIDMAWKSQQMQGQCIFSTWRSNEHYELVQFVKQQQSLLTKQTQFILQTQRAAYFHTSHNLTSALTGKPILQPLLFPSMSGWWINLPYGALGMRRPESTADGLWGSRCGYFPQYFITDSAGKKSVAAFHFCILESPRSQGSCRKTLYISKIFT